MFEILWANTAFAHFNMKKEVLFTNARRWGTKTGGQTKLDAKGHVKYIHLNWKAAVPSARDT